MHPPPPLLGRVDELKILRQLLADVRGGHSSVPVVRGEPGIGKTELLNALVADAAGFRVCRAVGVESEMELAYAGVHQLCVPLLGRLESLAEPQRRGLSVAFGLESLDRDAPSGVSGPPSGVSGPSSAAGATGVRAANTSAIGSASSRRPTNPST